LFDERLKELDLNFLANDVEPFLFSSEDKARLLTFRDYWKRKYVIAERLHAGFMVYGLWFMVDGK